MSFYVSRTLTFICASSCLQLKACQKNSTDNFVRPMLTIVSVSRGLACGTFRHADKFARAIKAMTNMVLHRRNFSTAEHVSLFCYVPTLFLYGYSGFAKRSFRGHGKCRLAVRNSPFGMSEKVVPQSHYNSMAHRDLRTRLSTRMFSADDMRATYKRESPYPVTSLYVFHLAQVPWLGCGILIGIANSYHVGDVVAFRDVQLFKVRLGRGVILHKLNGSAEAASGQSHALGSQYHVLAH